MNRDRRIWLTGLIGLIGCGVVIVTHFIAMVLLEGYDPVRETISDLAAGRYGWILDIGLVAYAAGILACAFGMQQWALAAGSKRWRTGLILLGILALDIMLIGVYNEYGNRDPGGVEIHIYLVYILGFGFALTVAFLGHGLKEIDTNWEPYSIALAVVWIFLAPPFLFISTNWDGLYERFLAVILVGWTAFIAWLLFQRGRGKYT